MKPAVGIDWLAVGRKEYADMKARWAVEDAENVAKRKAERAAKKKEAKRRAARKAQRPKRRAYNTRKYRTDVQYKLSKLFRTRLKRALKSQFITTSFQSHTKFLGCTVNQARAHIESQFESWMTWENHGKYGWHIDHIKPLSAFDLTDPAQVAEACHFTNLRPLHWRENLVKGGVKSRLSSGA